MPLPLERRTKGRPVWVDWRAQRDEQQRPKQHEQPLKPPTPDGQPNPEAAAADQREAASSSGRSIPNSE